MPATILQFQPRRKVIAPVAVPPAPVWPAQPPLATPADWIGLNVAACAIAAAAVVMLGMAIAMPWLVVPR
jgi:hypothetical protein